MGFTAAAHLMSTRFPALIMARALLARDDTVTNERGIPGSFSKRMTII